MFKNHKMHEIEGYFHFQVLLIQVEASAPPFYRVGHIKLALRGIGYTSRADAIERDGSLYFFKFTNFLFILVIFRSLVRIV